MNKSCDLKGHQKLFFLNQGTAASCCKAYSESLADYNTIDQLIDKWHSENVQLEAGNQVPSCEVCWQHENKGQLSYRLLPRGTSHNFIELFIDNACNQMCSYCSPKFSSTWQNNILEHGNFDNVSRTVKQNFGLVATSDHSQHWLDQIHQYIQAQPANSVTVKLAGGEPLMQIRQLQTLIDFNIDRVRQLRINTNLNPPSNKFLLWLLQRVPAHRLFFDISLDATPEFNHVPRAGFDAQQFLDNLSLIQQQGIEYCLLGVVSVLNIFDLPNFVAWAKQHRHPLQLLPLNNPDCLDARLLPDQFKSQIDCQDLPKLVQEILQPGQSIVDIKLFEQYNYLKQYFVRCQLDPDLTNNQPWSQYWQWLKERYQ